MFKNTEHSPMFFGDPIFSHMENKIHGLASLSIGIGHSHVCSYARSNVLMSSLCIWSIAFMTFCDFFVSLSCNILAKTAGTTCHETPYLSFSHPHCCAFSSPPSE